MKTVHLMGVAGSGMASLAGMFVEKGWKVRGSDQNIYPPASTELARLNVEIREGFRPENLEPTPDLVIVGNVISRTNPEAQALLSKNIPYTSMAQGLAENFIKGSKSLVVTGTHGKTTSTSLLAWILETAGMSPGLFVGGLPNNFKQGYRVGGGKVFVIEGDEYDTAFFEKTPKFLHYHPHDVIVTSIEFDHADIYRDLPHVIEQFEKLMTILPAGGRLIAWGDSETVRNVVKKRTNGITQLYGFDTVNDWRAVHIKSTESGTSFEIEHKGKHIAQIHSPLLGRHNVLNTVACFAMATFQGISIDKIVQGISSFEGVKRRQERIGEVGGILFYDDFAHHPTAIEETLAGFKPLAQARGGKLWALFEPRSNTIRRRVFQDTLPESFRLADEVIFSPVYRKADSLQEKDMLSPDELVASIQKRGGHAKAAHTYDEILDELVARALPKDVVLFMSNGNFGGLPLKVKEKFLSK